MSHGIQQVKDHIKTEVDKMEGLVAYEAKQYSLRRLNPAAFVWTLVSALCLACAVLCCTFGEVVCDVLVPMVYGSCAHGSRYKGCKI